MKEVKDYEKAYHRRENRHQLYPARRLLPAGLEITGRGRTPHRDMGTAASAVYPRAPPGTLHRLLLDGKLNGYLADLNEQAEDMFFLLVKELAEKKGITETLKAADQMEWVRRMNAVRETATEIVNNDLIYA